MESKLASINILTYNGQKFIKDCLKSVLSQTYKNVEILVIDNGSKDKTIEIIKEISRGTKENQRVKLLLNKKNLGFSAGHNAGIKKSKGEYVFCLNQDLILDKDFIKEIVKEFEKNPKIGSVQGKIYQLNNHKKTKIIDTVGFNIFKTGKILDAGQGQYDSPSTGSGRESSIREVFGVNGVVPAYRRTGLNDVKLKHEYFDENFFAYAEDIDLAWRLRWKGWLSRFAPKAIAWHDRTSAKTSEGGWKLFRQVRKSQSFWIRKMGWRNQWLLFIKNQSFFNALKFLYWFMLRQVKLFLYLLFFEPKIIFSSIPEIISLFPKMLKKRRIIMKNRKISNREMAQWFK